APAVGVGLRVPGRLPERSGERRVAEVVVEGTVLLAIDQDVLDRRGGRPERCLREGPVLRDGRARKARRAQHPGSLQERPTVQRLHGLLLPGIGPRRPAVTPLVYPTWVDRVRRGSERRMKLLRGRPPTWKIARPRRGRAIWIRRLEEVQFGSGWNCAGPPPTWIVVVFAGPVFVVEPDPPAGLEPPALATMS